MAAYTVKKDGTGNATTLQGGVNLLSSGDTLTVYGSVEYFEVIIIPSTLTNVTIVANAGDTPYVNGRCDESGYTTAKPAGAKPVAAWQHTSTLIGGSDYLSYTYAALVRIYASGVTWDGIDVQRSTGTGIYCNADDVTVQNCTISRNRGTGVYVEACDNFDLYNCELTLNVYFYLGNTVWTNGGNHPATFTMAGTSATGGATTIRSCNFHQNSGETLLMDINRRGSNGLTVTDTKFSDGRRALSYIHAAEDIEFNRCVFYGSSDQVVAPASQFGSVPYMKTLEARSKDLGPTYWGIDNVKYHNCLFVNATLTFQGENLTSSTTIYGRNVEVFGCTFISTDGSPLLFIGAATGANWYNVEIAGNIFYTTANMTNGSEYIGGTPSKANAWTIYNNLFNKQPLGVDTVLESASDVIGDPLLENPTAVVLKNAIDVANYKIRSASSPAIDEYLSPVTLDYFSGTRDTTPGSSLGFHCYNATGYTPPANTPPIADFYMRVSAIDVTSIAPGQTVNFTDESAAGSGTIDEWAWTIEIPNSTVTETSTLQDYTTTLTTEGTYTVKLTVTDDNDLTSTAVKSLMVMADIVTPPLPPPPPPASNQWANWTLYTKAGAPTYAYEVPAIRTIICATGDQGGWHGDFTGTVTPTESVSISVDVAADLDSGAGGLVALWYNSSGGTPIDSASLTLSDTTASQYYQTFNGTTTNIACGSDAALDDLHDAAMTVECWIRFNSLGESNAGWIVGKSDSGETTGWRLKVNTNGLTGIIDCATTNGNSQIGTDALYPMGIWKHIAMTWDDASYNYPRLWINGVEAVYDSTQNRSGAVSSDAADNLIIGNRADGARTLDGDIAWLRVSDTVRYTASFSPPGKDAPPASDANTVEQWNLNDGTGTTATAEEDSPTNDGTITDGAWTAISDAYVTYTLTDTVPATAAKLRVDVRLWSGVGTLTWKNPRLVSTTNIARPEAIIVATRLGEPVLTGQSVLIDSTIIFDGGPSTGTSITYRWSIIQQSIFGVSPWGDIGTSSTYTVQFWQSGTFIITLEVTDSSGNTDTEQMTISVLSISTLTTAFTKYLVGQTGPQDIIEAKSPFVVRFEPEAADEVEIKQYEWKIINSSTLAELGIIISGGPIEVTFPLAGYEDVTTYNITLTTTFITNQTATYSENARIHVAEGIIIPIGPPKPLDVGPFTANSVTKDGEHSHALVTTLTGAATAVPIVDSFGTLSLQFVKLLNSTISSGLGSGPDAIVYRLEIEGGIKFVDKGVITANDLRIDSPHIYAGKLPTTNPNVAGMLYNDSGTVKVSAGISTDTPETGFTTVQEYITASADDGNETSGGVVNLTDQLMRLNSTYTWMAFRFQGLAIAGTDTIESCTLRIYVHGSGLTLDADFYFDDADDSAALTTGANDISSRSLTTATVTRTGTYSAAGWQTIDLGTAALQEVIDRASWASGNDVTVILNQNTGCNLAVLTYDYYATAALLTVEYS